MDNYTKAILTVIALSLAVIAFKMPWDLSDLYVNAQLSGSVLTQ